VLLVRAARESRLDPRESAAPASPPSPARSDYGNAERDNHDDGAGTMEAVYFGNSPIFHQGWCGGAGENGTALDGPWVMTDLENGIWACGTRHSTNTAVLPMRGVPFVTAMVKGGSNGFGLKNGDATRGALVKTYEGPRPTGYQPMKKQGSIILGVGGDNSNSGIGTFFEGALTAGYSTDATDDLLQADIVAAGCAFLVPRVAAKRPIHGAHVSFPPPPRRRHLNRQEPVTVNHTQRSCTGESGPELHHNDQDGYTARTRSPRQYPMASHIGSGTGGRA
jgi:hypothetical protein